MAGKLFVLACAVEGDKRGRQVRLAELVATDTQDATVSEATIS
jgi:hypothetical protein